MQPREDDDPFSLASWQCVLHGFAKKVKVYKINQKELFKTVQVNNRYSVIDLWNVKSLEDFNALEPLEKNVAPEFDMMEMRNSVPIPPFMFSELTRANAWEADTLALEAIKAMKKMMAESVDLEDIMEEQEELDVPIISDGSTLDELTRRQIDNDERQVKLNKKWQTLAEECGLGAVLFFLNFDEANEVTFENITHIPSVAEAAFDLITSKLSSIFTVTGDEFTLMRDERTSTSRSLPVRQVDEQSFDDESSQERTEDPLL